MNGKSGTPWTRAIVLAVVMKGSVMMGTAGTPRRSIWMLSSRLDAAHPQSPTPTSTTSHWPAILLVTSLWGTRCEPVSLITSLSW